MRTRIGAVALAAVMVTGSVAGVFAQGHDELPGLEPTPTSAQALGTATVVRRGPRSSGAVALTFDDGFNAQACASIAQTLRRSDAVGTFFINGLWLQRDPVRWRRILRGMEVANHTRSHRNLAEAPRSVVINQIRSNEWIYERVLGRPMLKALRPPYGARSPRIRRIAGQLGYAHIVLWNVDTGDWRPSASPSRIVQAAIGAPPGSIILMHCAHDATAKALPRIVSHYQARDIDVAGLSAVLAGIGSR
jgi:peptidoglycan/xylan/chitin deacetylase (PgdA/CDA1 family)